MSGNKFVQTPIIRVYTNPEYTSTKNHIMNHSESWQAFIDELRTYVQEHHHFPNKHTRLLSRVKYTRRKINDGTLEEWKKEQFLEVANMRDMEEHCGGK